MFMEDFVFKLQRFATISNSNSNTLISGTSEADSITNYDDCATINTGNGDDYVYNYSGEYTKINTGEGNDSVKNWSGSKVTINTGEGNDSVYNDKGESATIDSGAGDDTVYNSGVFATIKTGTGNDLISLDSGSRDNVILYAAGDGNDTIYGFDGKDMLSISGGSYSTTKSGDNIVVEVGNGAITLIGAASLKAVNINGLFNRKRNTLISGTSGIDIITNYAAQVTISTGDGDDTVRNVYNYDHAALSSANSVSIDTGSGDDSVYSGGGYYATINTSEGDDSVYNSGNYAAINTGAGDDTVYNSSRFATINTGTGNDLISLSSRLYSHDNIILYKSGDGNDTIYGFNDRDMLSISGGSYSTTKSGDDIVVKVGNGAITLVGAAKLKVVDINGLFNTTSSALVSGTSDADIITNYAAQVTISTGDGDDTVRNFYTNDSFARSNPNSISIDTGSGDDSVYNEGYYATINTGEGDDSVYNSGNYAAINTGDDNDSVYNSSGFVTIKTGNGDDSVYNKGNSAIINTGAGNDSVINWYGSKVTINTGDGNDSVYNSGSYATIDTSYGDDSVSNSSSYATINTGAGDDSVKNGGSFATINTGVGDDSVYYDYGDYSTINTGAGDDYLYHSEGNYAVINMGAGNDTFYSIHYGSYAMINTGEGDDAVYNSSDFATIKTGTGNDLISLDSGSRDNVILYAAGDGNDTIYGFDGKDMLSISGGSYSTTKSGSDVIVTVGNGAITLVGAASLSKVNIDGEKAYPWKLDGTTAKYGNLVIVSGVKSVDGLSVSGKVITVGAASLDFKKVTVSGDYTLKLADDVNKSTSQNVWSHSGTTVTYSQSKSPGYTLASDSKSISYSKRSTTTLATVTGVKNKDALSISGKVITVGAAALDFKKVIVSDGYTLKLADDVNISKSENIWSHSGTTATYKQTASPGYTLASDSKSISYSKRSTTTLATVTGVKNKDALSISGKVITVGAAALDFKKVIVSDGYTLKLADDVNISKSENIWSHSGTTATYKQTASPGYSLASDSKSISYSKRSTTTLATVTGVKNKDALSVSGKIITVGAAALDFKKVIVSDGYTLKLADDVNKSTSQNVWSHSGTIATYSQTKSPGYTLASDSKSISYSKRSTTTLATITGAKNTSGLSVSGNKITLNNSSLNKAVTIGGGYEFDFAADYENATIMGSSKADTITARGDNVSIHGGAGDDKIFGGAGNSSLWGGEGDDWLYGGAGKDLFVYSGGNDTISDYEQGLDKIMILSDEKPGLVNTPLSNNLTFKVGDGSIVVENGLNRTIEFVKSNGEYLHTHIPVVAN